jgi:lactaldehyde reductase
VRSPLAVATSAVLDPKMVSSVPQPVAAAAGIDALTHLLESYVGNVGRWEITDALNLYAIEMVGHSILPYWKNRADEKHARNMQIASCIGGLALSHSRTGIVHQMARPLGAKFHVPHGMANAVLLPWCLAFTASREPERFARVARALDPNASSDDQTAAAGLAGIVHCLNKTMQVPSSLVSFGVAEADLEDLAQDALQGKATVTNPCVVTLQEVVDIYRNAYIGDTNG